MTGNEYVSKMTLQISINSFFLRFFLVLSFLASAAKASLKRRKKWVVVDSDEETLMRKRQSLEQDVLEEDNSE